MGYNQNELEYWANFAAAMGNVEFRDLFKKMLQETIDEDNKLIAREGLQNPSVNSLEYMEDQFEHRDS